MSRFCSLSYVGEIEKWERLEDAWACKEVEVEVGQNWSGDMQCSQFL